MWRKSARRNFLKGYCRAATQKLVTLTIVGRFRFGPYRRYEQQETPVLQPFAAIPYQIYQGK
jgi:hypothetical protein